MHDTPADSSSHAATVKVFAKTTSLWQLVLAWQGLPILAGAVVQSFLMAGTSLKPLIPLAVLFVPLWLALTFQVARRRWLKAAPEALHFPRVFGGTRTIDYGDIAGIDALAQGTVALVLKDGQRLRFQSFDPQELERFLEVVLERARLQPMDVARVMGRAGTRSAQKTERRVGVLMFALGLVFTGISAVFLPMRISFLLKADRAHGTVVRSIARTTRGNAHSYAAVVTFTAPTGETFFAESYPHSTELAAGTPQDVLYAPGNPGNNLVDDFGSKYALCVLALLGPVLLVVSGRMVFRNPR